MDESKKNVMFVGIIVVVVLIVGYVLWSRSAPPEPTLGPGQSIQNPFGNNAPKTSRKGGG
jgi:hypothetical protein